MFTLKATVKDLGVKSAIAKLGKQCADPRQALQEARIVMKRSTDLNFAQGGRPEKWEPSGRVKFGGGKTLMQKGLLKNSIQWDVRGKNALVGGTNVSNKGKSRAIAHQIGMTIKAKPGNKFGGNLIFKVPGIVKKTTVSYVKEKGSNLKYSNLNNTLDTYKIRTKESAVIGKTWIMCKQVKIPKREFLLFQPEDLTEIADLVANQAVKGV